MPRSAAAGAFAALALLAATVGPPPAAAAEDPPADLVLHGDAAHGAKLFAKHCAVCHGAGGHGDGMLAPHLRTPPRDLTDRERMDQRSDRQILLTVRDGGAAVGLSPVMTAFADRLSPAEIEDVATFVRSLSRPPAE